MKEIIGATLIGVGLVLIVMNAVAALFDDDCTEDAHVGVGGMSVALVMIGLCVLFGRVN